MKAETTQIKTSSSLEHFRISLEIVLEIVLEVPDFARDKRGECKEGKARALGKYILPLTSPNFAQV